MAEYQISEPFDTDGSFDELSKEQCFALGAEWAAFRARLLTSEKFTSLCHTANARRLSAMAERHGRFAEHRHYADGWSLIFVGDRNG